MRLVIDSFWIAITLFNVLLAQPEQKYVGAIDFFGYKGLNLAPIRSALPVHEGDAFPGTRSMPEWKQAISESVKRVINQDPTDVRMVCCDEKKNYLIYVGFPGASSKNVTYDSAPTGESRLPPNFLRLDEELNAALREAIMRGAARVDTKDGYALALDPAVRAKQLELRDNALQNEEMLINVLRTSSDAQHRAIAATAVGYTRQSDIQIAALTEASFDPEPKDTGGYSD